MTTAVPQSDPSVVARIQAEVQRAIQRNIKGVEYFTSPAPAVGSTSKVVLHVRGTMNLYHYHPLADEVYRVPVLLVMAPTNRAYVFDLAPGQSLVEFLLKRGYDVFVLDWAPPRPDEKMLQFDSYALDFLPDAIRRIQIESGEADVTILGYCAGGILSLIYTSLHADGQVKNLVCFTTPIDFHQMTLFRNWSDERYFDVDKLVNSLGNVPPEVVTAGFDMLRPASRAFAQINLWDNVWNDEYVKSYRMFDRWGTDTLPLPGEYFRQMIKDLLWRNKLYNDQLVVGGRKVNLANIKIPILHAVAEHDHIAPYEATKHLIPKVGSTDKEEIVFTGGHVSVIAGANAIRRLWPKLDNWLGARST